MAKFEDAIPVIMAHEGTDKLFWVHDPADLGGETVWGWSMLTIKRLGLTPQDLGLPHRDFFPGCLKAVTKQTCQQLYRKYFWNQYGYYNVVDQVAATKMMDAAVNMGPKRAAEFAQRACNTLGASLSVDGSLGPKSWAAINACDPVEFVRTYGDEMAAYYKRIVEARPLNGKFLKNWLRRAAWGVQPTPAQ
jgi:lysozyme family protein